MKTICDTGPIVAFLNRRDPFHEWAVSQFAVLRPPLFTCEAVLTEAFYFLRSDGLVVEPLFEMLERKALAVDFRFSDPAPRIRKLMHRFSRMDFADACVVAMSERWERCQVLTLDVRDFSVYRRHDRQTIPLVTPRPGVRGTKR